MITSSVARLKGIPNTIHYTPAEHGVVGIMRTLAQESAPHPIRVNSVHPRSVEPVDISNAILFLVSDEARYITGVTQPIDAGSASK